MLVSVRIRDSPHEKKNVCARLDVSGSAAFLPVMRTFGNTRNSSCLVSKSVVIGNSVWNAALKKSSTLCAASFRTAKLDVGPVSAQRASNFVSIWNDVRRCLFVDQLKHDFLNIYVSIKTLQEAAASPSAG